jgi:hypothetical protein
MFGSTWLLDGFNLYVFTSVSVIAFALSIFSLVIFTNSEFHISIYSYLRVYSVVNVLQALINIFNFTFSSERFITWSNSYPSFFFCDFFYVPVTNLLYYFTSIIGLVVLLERLSIFTAKVRPFFIFSPQKTCLIIFIICFVTDLPYYFGFVPGSQVLHVNRTTTFTAWFSDVSPFSKSQLGKVLSLLVMAVRDLLVLGIESIMNVVSVFLFKAYLNNKRRLQGNESNGLSTSDQRITIMAILMCLTSAVVHFLQFLANIYPLFEFNLFVFVIYGVANFVLPLKCCVDFALFFFFDRNFQRVCLRYVGIDEGPMDFSTTRVFQSRVSIAQPWTGRPRFDLSRV